MLAGGRRVRACQPRRAAAQVNLREDLIIGEVDRWLAREFATHRLHETITDLEAAQFAESGPRADGQEEVALKIAECDRKLAQYRAALDAGASPATAAAWIGETEAEKAGYLAVKRPNGGATRRRMNNAEIKAIVDRLAELVPRSARGAVCLLGSPTVAAELRRSTRYPPLWSASKSRDRVAAGKQNR